MTLIEQWRQQGMERGLQLGLEQGIEQGLEQGMEQGLEQGMERGQAQGRRAQLGRLLRKRFGAVADEPRYQERLRQAGVEQLDLWAEQLLDAESIDEVFAD